MNPVHPQSRIKIPAVIHTAPAECFQTARRLWQGCPTIERTPGGRLFAGWYSGGMCEPDMRNYNLLVRSDDNGATWSDPILVMESVTAEGIRCIDVELWMDPNGVLRVFWTQILGWGRPEVEHHETWCMTTDNPDADEIVWSEPFYVTDGFLRCKPTVLRNGTILLCAYLRSGDHYMYSQSSDGGKSWELCTGGKKIPTWFDESMILEHRDGSLHLFARTNSTATIAESVSQDGGVVWSDGISGSLTAPPSRFYIARLKSGNILRINSNHPKERTNLTAFLSFDDGKSWPASLLLDNRHNVSYPDAVEDDSGHISIVYDKGRVTDKEIYLSCITEKDICAGALVEETSFIARLVNKAPIHPLFPR
ncbi:MAG: sialidase family protein [Victivallaceae bacterium]|nr:sialidase family protein [Victivallaceae bacterium]